MELLSFNSSRSLILSFNLAASKLAESLFATLIVSVSMCVAQDATPPPPPAPSAPAESSSGQTVSDQRTEAQKTSDRKSAEERARNKSAAERAIEKQEQKQRAVGILPQFAVTSRQDASPLTSGEKFRLMLKSAHDPAVFGIVGIQAGISQAENDHPGYGQGWGGFGKRYGAALADTSSSNFFANFFWPVILKQDPRFYRSGEGPIRNRIGHALLQEFKAHRDNGGVTFNFSNVLGAFSSGTLSNAYYPSSDRGIDLTIQGAAISLLYGSFGGMVSEFSPDINHYIHRHRHKHDMQSPPPAATQ